jgi:hypothetical protein
MPRARTTRVYKKGSRFYGDFRDIGGKLEALKPLGSTSATDDLDVANALCVARVKELESIKRGIAIVGTGSIARLGEYAKHHLLRKKIDGEATDWTLGGVERCLERAVEYFGSNRPLATIDIEHVQAWVPWLREPYALQPQMETSYM